MGAFTTLLGLPPTLMTVGQNMTPASRRRRHRRPRPPGSGSTAAARLWVRQLLRPSRVYRTGPKAPSPTFAGVQGVVRGGDGYRGWSEQQMGAVAVVTVAASRNQLLDAHTPHACNKFLGKGAHPGFGSGVPLIVGYGQQSSRNPTDVGRTFTPYSVADASQATPPTRDPPAAPEALLAALSVYQCTAKREVRRKESSQHTTAGSGARARWCGRCRGCCCRCLACYAVNQYSRTSFLTLCSLSKVAALLVLLVAVADVSSS